ncbi:MAG: phosphohydrolase [Desulfotomaculum sp. BICA1-6]|nr:MAG: phosphohydrolase [Desulfotomaculum sp. BICA1-6]
MAEINLQQLLMTLSSCLDFDEQGINDHHNKVCQISLSLANQIGLNQQDKNLIGTAAVIHDIGVTTWGERDVLLKFEVNNPWDHCISGAELVRKYSLLEPLSDVILNHHSNFAGGNQTGLARGDIPLASRIIHLADRVDVLINNLYKMDKPILCYVEQITDRINSLSGTVFDPELVEQFTLLSQRESFWLDLIAPEVSKSIKLHDFNFTISVDKNEILQLANMFADVIDRKSPFTYRHSRGVAGTAVLLASAMGFGENDLVNMKIAGLLHDIGKLSIRDGILEKPGKLTDDEFTEIKQHTYYTYHILVDAGANNEIPQWAAYHHEKLDGSGYPFHLDASQLSLGSRIVAAADVFTALREDRPYRRGMERHAIEEIMNKMVHRSALDKEVVHNLFGIYRQLDDYFISLL